MQKRVHKTGELEHDARTYIERI